MKASFVLVVSLLVSTIAFAETKSQFRSVDISACTFSNDTDANSLFPLKVGHKKILAGKEKKKPVVLVISVLDQIKHIEVAGKTIDARVVEERETNNGQLSEVALNYFALCNETKDVLYFGEDVTKYERGRISKEGSWEAGVNNASPGIQMPGQFIVGDRYWQERSPGVAEDRAYNLRVWKKVVTSAGTFNECVEVLETSALDKESSHKFYCPGVGLTISNELKLTKE